MGNEGDYAFYEYDDYNLNYPINLEFFHEDQQSMFDAFDGTHGVIGNATYGAGRNG